MIRRRILASLLALAIIVCLCPISSLAESDGKSFVAAEPYVVARPFAKMPNTFEAWVKFPANTPATHRGGVILGNYGDGSCINFEVYTGGKPRIYYVDNNNGVTSKIFEGVNLYTGNWIHLAIVRNATAGNLTCYINGQAVETVAFSVANYLCANKWVLGGDQRSGNTMSFTGEIRSAAVFSDARTAAEIQSDMVCVGNADLLASWDLRGADSLTYTDLSGNGYNANKDLDWYTTGKEPVTDYAYSFAVVGDTQIITDRHPEQLTKIYDWIVANRQSKNIQYVFGMGDITDRDTDAEWQLAYEQISKLNGVVPYCLNRGNHDSSAQINATFAKAPYSNTYAGSYEQGKMESTWRELVVGNIKYLIMTLDYGAHNDVLAWADQVIANHPNHNVIITTHAYLFRDGTTLDKNDLYPPSKVGGYNNGDDMWEKLVRKHKNIVLVMSGHDPCDDVVMTQTVGDHGNVVTQMLIDPQNMDVPAATGMVAMLYFSKDGKQVSVEYYSTVRNQYFKPSNQYYFELDLIDEDTSSTVLTYEAPDSSYASWQTVDYTNARLCTKVKAQEGNLSRILFYGMEFYDANGSLLKRVENWNIPSEFKFHPTAHLCFDVNTDLGLTLTPDTTYKYKFFIVNGVDSYWGQPQTLKTKSSIPVFEAPTDPTYTSKETISNNNATIVSRVSLEYGTFQNATNVGAILYNANSEKIGQISETPSSSFKGLNDAHIWYDLQTEMGLTLCSGTSYQYKFFVTYNGTTYYSNARTFTTTGTENHNYSGWVKGTANQHKRSCVCGHTQFEDHKWDSGVITTPAGATPGVKTYTCTVCQETKTETFTQCTQHVFDDNQWSQYNNLKHQHKCLYCNEVEYANHRFDAGVVTNPASCQGTGTKLYTCQDCRFTREADIPQTNNHNHAIFSKYNQAQHKKSCACGDYVLENHRWNSGVVTSPADHLQPGVRTYTCLDCQETKTERIDPDPQHSYGGWQKHNSFQHKKVCACLDTIYEDHRWDNGVVTSPADHLQPGVRTYTCLDCQETKTERIDPDPQHSYGGWQKHNSFQHKKVCACLDTIYEDHRWDNGVVNGNIKTYTCLDCQETREEDITLPDKTLSLIVSSESGTVNKTVSVTVSLQNNPGFGGMAFDLFYDANLLEGVSYQAGWANAGFTSSGFENGKINFQYAGLQNVSQNGVLIVLTFQIKEGATLGSTSISLSPIDNSFFGYEGQREYNIIPSVTNGSVTIEAGYLKGDINGDGILNNRDAARLLQYLANWDVEVVEEALDTTGDGIVNNRDAARILQYLANWDVVIH